MLFVSVSPTNRTNHAQRLLEFLTLRVILAGNIDLPLSILLHCHSGLSEVKTPNPGVLFQILFSNRPGILIPDQIWEGKKITFSLSLDKHVKSCHFRGMVNPETCKYLK